MALIETIRNGSISEIQSLLQREVDSINVPNEKGITPLIASIASGRREIIKYILENGANPNYTTSRSPLPLLFAIDSTLEEDDYDEKYSEIRTDVIKMLINFGADINKVDVQEQESPIDYSKGRSKVIEDLFNELSSSDSY